MTPMLERATNAVRGVLGTYASPRQCEEVARAVMQAMRDPTAEMLSAAPKQHVWELGRNNTPECWPTLNGGPSEIYRAMIDAAIARTPAHAEG